MKKAYQRRLPTILEKKTPQRERLPCCGLVFNLSRAGCDIPVPTPSPHCSDAITRSRMGALSEAVESRLPTGEGPSRTPADSRKYCLGFFRVLWSCLGDLDVYRLVGGEMMSWREKGSEG